MDIFNILTFDYDRVVDQDIITIDPDWTDILSLNTVDRVAGTYGLVFSLKFTLDSTAQSFLYRFSLDGGTTWGEVYQKEVKDRSNTEVIEVIDVLEHTGGVIQLAVQVTRESTADCIVREAFISAERKG